MLITYIYKNKLSGKYFNSTATSGWYKNNTSQQKVDYKTFDVNKSHKFEKCPWE